MKSLTNYFVLLALHDKNMENQLAENKKTENQECIENHKRTLLDEIREVMAKRDELQKTWKSQGTQRCV